jgi:hypothetical protein
MGGSRCWAPHDQRRGAKHGGRAAGSAGNGSRPAGTGGRCMHARHGAARGRVGLLTHGPLLQSGRRQFEFILNSISKRVQIISNFADPKNDFPKLKIFEIKYAREDIEKMNNFFHRNFFRFRRDMEYKFREFSRFRI